MYKKKTLYLIGYNCPDARAYLDRLEEKGILILDTRKDPVGRDPFWHQNALEQRYSWYVWVGYALGNKNHGTGKPIELADPEQNLHDIAEILRSGKDLALLCVCRDDRCHNRVIAALLREQVPELCIKTMEGMTPYA